MDMSPITTNRLGRSPSPYLQQHAGNPVDWWPWCDEAIALARSLDRPLFVSIGYSTCYWCHVMERESFEDPAVGQALREGFVAIKVDREEHPTVDEWLMTACQVMTEMTEGRASGGWPLNGFIDPHSMRAFHVGTYYPPHEAHGRPSFRRVLSALTSAWRDRRADVTAQAAQIGGIVEDVLTRCPPPAPIARALPMQVAQALLRFEDSTNGGFGGAPKFPQPCYLRLVREVARDLPSLQPTVVRALDGMVGGGLLDQVGGGFHRYCVDATWTVPHFEKMLYDNGQLLELLAVGCTRAPQPGWRAAIERTIDWLDREMRDADGACIAALDAEVDGREGLNYLWTPHEAEDALATMPLADRRGAIEALGLDAINFRDPHHHDEPPRTVPTRRAWTESAAVDAACGLLLARRNERRQPRRDTKVILEWNGLLIEGLAEAGIALGRPSAIDRAVRIAESLWSSHRRDGIWHRTLTAGTPGPRATLADLACFGLGLESLWRATGDRTWLGRARELEATARAACCDDGRWWSSPDPVGLPTRLRSHHDGAVPSGLGAVIDLQVRLALATRDDTDGREILEALARTLHAESGTIVANPVGLTWAVAALARAMREGLVVGADSPAAHDSHGGGSTGARRVVCSDGGCRVAWD